MVGRLNRKLRGWANYFDVGAVSRAYHAVNYHVTNRLRRWLCRKAQGQGAWDTHDTQADACSEDWAFTNSSSRPKLSQCDRVRNLGYNCTLFESRMP